MHGPARRIALAALIAAGAALGAAGCGLGPGPATGNISLTVTGGFGERPVGAVSASRVPGSETVMRFLERSFRVDTRYGGGFVESIDGLSGSSDRRDWFYYVNGVEAPAGAAQTAVHHGDRIWWDLHDWSATESVPAVVGSFPEPFVHGVGGRRFPTTLQCASGVGDACDAVAGALSRAGVPAARQLFGTGSGTSSLNVVVGPWPQLRPLLAADLIDKGPSASGVYARFGVGGSSLALLDPHGNTVRTLGPGAGLVAATADQSSTPTWLITGTDAAGVLAAARSLSAARLRDDFALAVTASGGAFPIPLRGES